MVIVGAEVVVVNFGGTPSGFWRGVGLEVDRWKVGECVLDSLGCFLGPRLDMSSSSESDSEEKLKLGLEVLIGAASTSFFPSLLKLLTDG